jgi:hypothetical protein
MGWGMTDASGAILESRTVRHRFSDWDRYQQSAIGLRVALFESGVAEGVDYRQWLRAHRERLALAFAWWIVASGLGRFDRRAELVEGFSLVGLSVAHVRRILEAGEVPRPVERLAMAYCMTRNLEHVEMLKATEVGIEILNDLEVLSVAVKHESSEVVKCKEEKPKKEQAQSSKVQIQAKVSPAKNGKQKASVSAYQGALFQS